MGVLQFKRGDTKPALQEGEPFFDTDKKAFHVGENFDVSATDFDKAAIGFSKDLHGKIAVAVIDDTTKAVTVHYLQPNIDNPEIANNNGDNKASVFIGSGVTLSGTTHIRFAHDLNYVNVHFHPSVDFDENSNWYLAIDANTVRYMNGPLFKIDTEKQRLLGGEIEIFGVFYFDENGDDNGASMGTKYKGLTFDSDENMFGITPGDTGEFKVTARKIGNNALRALGDTRIFPSARAIKTSEGDNADIVGVDIEMKTFYENADSEDLVIFRPFGLSSDGTKRYYPDINHSTVIQFHIKIAATDDGWSDELTEL